jgi:hypothetical protein
MRILKTVVLSIAIVSITACFTKTGKSSASLKFKEISYGYCKGTNGYFIPSDISPSGRRHFSNTFEITHYSDIIPASMGYRFGVHFEIKSPIDTALSIERIWTFPKIISDHSGNKYEQVKRTLFINTNDPTYTTYFFEEEYEIVPGEWKLQMFHNNKLLYEKRFIIQ